MDEVDEPKPIRYNLRSSIKRKIERESTNNMNTEENDESDTKVGKKMRYNLRSYKRQTATNTAGIEKPEQSIEFASNLMSLNDYCLLEIFDFLKPKALSKIAYVNKRLNTLTKYYIQSKYKIPFAADFVSANSTVPISMVVIEAFLCIFGKEITALTLSRDSFDGTFNDYTSMGKILSDIQQYCTNIEEFTLKGFGTCGLNQNFFDQLKTLTLDKCSVSRDWSKMSQLQKLYLNQVIFRQWPLKFYYQRNAPPISIPVHCFGQLKEARLIDVNIENMQMKKLIDLNPMIEALSIVKCFQTSSFLFGAVGNLKNLKEFEFKRKTSTNGIADTMALNTLKQLKVLKFAHKKYKASTILNGFINNGIDIEHLELGLCDFDDAAALCIANLRTIKVLHFNEMKGLNKAHILSIGNNLKLLEEFQIKMTTTISQDGLKDFVRATNRLKTLKVDIPGFKLDGETYEALLSTIKERTNQTTLELVMYGDGAEPAMPHELLNVENEKWLVVKEIDRRSDNMFDDLTSKVGHPPPRYNDYDSDYYDSDYYDSDY